ncbi:MAG: AAA family ATPase [Prochlorococcaceae cyanobacterium]|jgi:energy-coupling factor transporter ATP-binding protein EcfA2
MRLRSVRLRHYRLHRELSVAFDPRFTVISGPNQSGKSTLAEALHRALFLPVKTGGAVLEALRSDPFRADPEVELAFECGGEAWALFKRFAGSRGSVTLQDARGCSLQGDEAEQRLAELIGTAAVPRTRAAGEQLKERWAHLWVWQGAASLNPLGQNSAAYDHDRLVGRLQAGAELAVQSPLDRAVLDDIQRRWGEVYTPGGANRAPQVRRGSALQQARDAVAEAERELQATEALLAEQEEARCTLESASTALARIAEALPAQRLAQRGLGERQARCQELQRLIQQEELALAPLERELEQQQHDRQQLEALQRRVAELEAAQAPRARQLEELRQRRQSGQAEREAAQRQRDGLQQALDQARRTVEAAELRLQRARLTLEGQQTAARLEQAQALQQRLDRLERELALLPALGSRDMEWLRALERQGDAARARVEAMAAGIEVIRASRPVTLAGEPLPEGSSRLLAQPASLKVGDDVELRLIPGGGATAAEAEQQRQAAERALEQALQRWKLPSVEEAATAERRRSDLLAERQSLLEQRAQEDPVRLQRRLESLRAQFRALPPAPGGDEPAPQDPAPSDPDLWIQQLEAALEAGRGALAPAEAAEREHRDVLQNLEKLLEGLAAEIDAGERALREEQNQLLEARTRLDALLQRWSSAAALEASIAELLQRREGGQARLRERTAERTALDPTGLEAEGRRLEAEIAALEEQERQAREARIRAEARLQGDGRVDLPAEREQLEAALESRRLDCARLEKEAAMLSLLRRLLEEEQNALASRYTAPLTERIGAYLAHVFPEPPRADLSYDARDGFRSLQWRRGGEAAFRFEVLSAGAREQFAAALRLAMAAVLAEAYDGSLPLVFDDAFANSDPGRQQGVVRMLRQAAEEGLQVILLTCDPRSTGELQGSHRLELPEPSA